MYDKMLKVFDSENFITENAYLYYAKENIQYVPQRWEGLVYDFLNIMYSPYIGYGDNNLYSYISAELFFGLDIDLVNGLVQIIAMLGIPLGILFYIIMYHSSMMLSFIYNYKGKYLFFMLLCAVNVSYNFFFEPIIIAFVSSSYFIKGKYC